MNASPRLGVAGVIVRTFAGSMLTPLLIVGSVLVGLLAIVLLPREEEPQIKVPVVDIAIAPHRRGTPANSWRVGIRSPEGRKLRGSRSTAVKQRRPLVGGAPGGCGLGRCTRSVVGSTGRK